MKTILYILTLVGALTIIAPQTANAAVAIEIIDQDHQVGVSVVESTLRVTGANGQILTIYNVTGVQVMSIKVDGHEKHYDLNLPKGCYIVKIGKVARKIYIK